MKKQNQFKAMKKDRKQYPTFRQFIKNDSLVNNLCKSFTIEAIDKYYLKEYLMWCRPDILAERDQEEFLDKIEAELATPNF